MGEYIWSRKARNLDESNTPLELIQFRDKWKREFSESTLEPRWPEKYAGFLIEYKGEVYRISPYDFGVNDSEFAIFSREMEDELSGIAEQVHYTGMLD